MNCPRSVFIYIYIYIYKPPLRNELIVRSCAPSSKPWALGRALGKSTRPLAPILRPVLLQSFQTEQSQCDPLLRPKGGGGPGKVVPGAVELLSEVMVDHYAQKRSIVVSLAPPKVQKMVPKWSGFSILRILSILEPLSIDSSVFEGPRDSVFSICVLICLLLSDSVFGPLLFMFGPNNVTKMCPKWTP